MIAISEKILESTYHFSGRTKMPGFRMIVFVSWLITFNSISLPGRDAPITLAALDWIGVVKVITRLFIAILLTVTLFRLPHTIHKRVVMRRLFPFAIFGLWAIFSVVWSSKKAVSFGHSMEIPIYVLLAAVTGILCVDNNNVSRLLFNLSICALVYCMLFLMMYYLFSNSMTSESLRRSSGFVHPNVSAQVAGAGLLTLVACRLLWNWAWTRVLLLPVLVIEGLVLFLTQSRTAIISTFVLLFMFALLVKPRGFILIMPLFIFVASMVFLIMQSDFQYSYQPAVRYIMRNQAKEEFVTATGRTKIWAIGLKSFLHSPVLGNGYYVFTKVWGITGFHAGHNILLHVLTGTGAIGGILLFWGLSPPLMAARRSLHFRSKKRKAAILVFTLVSWFFLVGIFELSFLGQLGFPPLLFFVILGIAAAGKDTMTDSKNHREQMT